MISPHISEAEAFKSITAIKRGIDNTTTDPEILANMKHVAMHVFEPLRSHFNRPIGITSFYRSPELNKAVKGDKNSNHLKGEAIDIDADVYGNLTNKEIFDWIRNNLEYDQLIFEGKKADGNPEWVHVSLRRNIKNRKMVLFADFSVKPVKYIKYI